ncbi:AimR family lysis-lysogeny pheromone receptor [Bacillus sp. FSL M7-0996]|uniref:AimR family lysis-lysogeny pheromone receptor n=1 Tax=Bacillus sp. FSL M7-0996 TaxID=2921538 RepID=UPI0030FC4C30
METLIKKIKDDLYVAKITNKELAGYWSVTPSIVSDVLNGRTQMRFCYFSKTLNYLYKDTTIKRNLIKKYIEKNKLRNLREAMEYLSLQGDFELLKQVVDTELNAGASSNKEWASVYDLIYRMYTEEWEFKTLYNLIMKQNRSSKTLEMKILTEILICQMLYHWGNYRLLFNRLQDIELDIKNIKNKFIRKCFDIRFKEAFCIISLQRGNTDETRRSANEILDLTEQDPFFVIPKINALLKLGESYIFEDYKTAKFFLEKSLETLERVSNIGIVRKKQLIKNTLNFLFIYWGEEMDYLETEIHCAELAYLKIKKGKKKEAEELLMYLEKQTGELTDFQTLYLGLAKEDKNLIKKALEMCEETGNIFYSQLPKKYLGLN